MDDNETLKENLEFMREFSLNKAKEFGKNHYGYVSGYNPVEFGGMIPRTLMFRVRQVENSNLEDNKNLFLELIKSTISNYENELEISKKKIANLNYSIEAIANLNLTDQKLSKYIIDSAIGEVEHEEVMVGHVTGLIAKYKEQAENFNTESVEEEIEKLHKKVKYFKDGAQLSHNAKRWIREIAQELDTKISL